MQSQILPVNFGVFQPGAPDSTMPFEDHDIWSKDQLQDFAERMATHGMAISCVRLRKDAGYTLRQLAKAHVMNDEVLCDMVMALSHQFEKNSLGIPARLSD